MSTITETATMSTPNTKSDKKAKAVPKKIVTLKLAPNVLAKFPSSSTAQETTQSKIKPDPDSLSASVNGANGETSNDTAADNVSESPSTPAPGDSVNGDAKKKGGSSAKAGVKRSIGEGTPRPRGRPGPKKKPRLDDGTDAGVRTSFGGAVPLVHKLGPRANQGAINAGLRALDRSGKPCRKWEKKPFMLKSFTGVMWEVPSWKAPHRQDIVNGDANSTSNTGESESKPNESSTGLPSEKSNQGDQSDQVEPTGLVTPAASSPPPATPIATIEA